MPSYFVAVSSVQGYASTPSNRFGRPSTPTFSCPPAVCIQVWAGKIVDPEPIYPRTVSISWADPCEVEVRAAAIPMYYSFLSLSMECEPYSVLNLPFLPGGDDPNEIASFRYPFHTRQ